MTLGAVVHDALVNDGGVGALVSTRVYPLTLPQTPTLPAVTYQRISNSPQNGSTDLRGTRWQVSCWATTHVGAEALAAAVKTLFEEYSDEDQTPGIKMGQVVNELDDYEPETEQYRVIVDVIFDTTGD